MSREPLQEELEALRGDVLSMGELVRSRLATAIDALAAGPDADAAAAAPDAIRNVIDGDQEINERYLAIESRCIDCFALQQPVASDLRIVAASFKISTDLERIADLAVNLAERANEPPADPTIDLHGLGEVALTMVDDALAAYEQADVWACHEVAETDDELDELCDRATAELFRRLVADESAAPVMADSAPPERAGTGGNRPTPDAQQDNPEDLDAVEAAVAAAAWQLLVIRDLERVGDHAENVAARTCYMVEQDDTLLE
jgi:phosphate transport system protein